LRRVIEPFEGVRPTRCYIALRYASYSRHLGSDG